MATPDAQPTGGSPPVADARLNNQLGVILAHAELLEARPATIQRSRATQVVSAALQAMSLAREIRSTMADAD